MKVRRPLAVVASSSNELSTPALGIISVNYFNVFLDSQMCLGLQRNEV